MASAFVFKTLAEQKVEWLNAERLVRKLTDDEWQELGRAEHAVYCRNIRLARRLEAEQSGALREHRHSEQETLRRVAREAIR